MREPVPCPSASRGRIPPEPPTAVGLMERPEWGGARAARDPWWMWILIAPALLVGLLCVLVIVPMGLIVGRLRRLGRSSAYRYASASYQGRVPLNFPRDPSGER